MATIRRREFLKAAAGAAAVMATPTILTAKKTDSPIILGEGEYQYEAQHNWPQLPDKYTWQTTHDVAFDKAGNLYVIHEGTQRQARSPGHLCLRRQGQVRPRIRPGVSRRRPRSRSPRRGRRRIPLRHRVPSAQEVRQADAQGRQRFGSGTRRWNRASTPRAKTKARRPA